MKTYKSSDTESEDHSVAESDVEDLADAEQQVEWRDAGLVDEEEKKSRDGRGPRCRWWICTYNNPPNNDGMNNLLVGNLSCKLTKLIQPSVGVDYD